MQAIQALKRRRIALLGESNRVCLRQFTSFVSSRSVHATGRQASLAAMRRPPPELYLQFYLRNRLAAPAHNNTR